MNKYEDEAIEVPETLRVDQASEDAQVARLKDFKANRDQDLVDRRLEDIRTAARGSDNLLPVLREALRDNATLGETCGAMRDVFGIYRPEF